MHDDSEDEAEFVYPGLHDKTVEVSTQVAGTEVPLVVEVTHEPEVQPEHVQSNEEEEFVYPGSAQHSSPTSVSGTPSPLEHTPEPDPQEVSSEDDHEQRSGEEEEPSVSSSNAKPARSHPTPAQLESLIAASSSGDLTLLQNLFRNALQTGEVEPFALANDASTRSGLTALHIASSRGYLEVVKWCKSHVHPHQRFLA